MKKIIAIVLLFITISVHAQLNPVLKSKRGILILPQKGSFAVGLSASPFLAYIGNIANGSSSNNGPSVAFANFDQMVFGKYMKTNNYAYRASFRIGVRSNSFTSQVKDLSPGAAADATVEDVSKSNSTNIGLGLGFEKRRGSTRLQGIYGAEALIGYSSGLNTKYESGNAIEYFGPGFIRGIKTKGGSSFTFGARAFVGIEYFFAPQIAIGGEFGYGLNVNIRGESNETRERYDFNNNVAEETTVSISPKANTIALDTDNYNGILKLLFYF